MNDRKSQNNLYPSPLFLSPSDVMGRILKQSGLNTAVTAFDILEKWPEIVGTRIAEDVQCLRLENGVLHLKAKNSVWKSEIHYQKNILIEKANQILGRVIVKEIQIH